MRRARQPIIASHGGRLGRTSALYQAGEPVPDALLQQARHLPVGPDGPDGTVAPPAAAAPEAVPVPTEPPAADRPAPDRAAGVLPGPAELAGMRKADLLALAREAGLLVGEGETATAIRARIADQLGIK